jgi:hypothetical protein
MPTTKPIRVLPADVYDALEFSALVFGGIGGITSYDPPGSDAPNCAYGHAAHVTNVRSILADTPTLVALRTAGIDAVFDNDSAVGRLDARKGRRRGVRVTFREWCRELHVIRGD